MSVRHTVIVFAAALVAGAARAAAPAPSWDDASPGSFALRAGGAEVWRFHADPARDTKPYFDPVRVAGGPPLTWARVPDHPWHLGLWFSWKYINGVNYWEESGGKPAGTTAWEPPARELRPDGSAVIRLRLTYSPAGLREEREIAVSAPAADGSYTMDWVQRFTAGARTTLDRTPIPGEPHGSPHGGYAGLSVRFARAITNVETVASTVGRVPRDAAGRLDVTAPAVEQNGVVDGEPYGIAILAHPANPRAPGDWYPIENPAGAFHYLNAAFLLKSAYTLQAGETLTLRYRVCVHPGRWDAASLRQASARYADACPAP